MAMASMPKIGGKLLDAFNSFGRGLGSGVWIDGLVVDELSLGVQADHFTPGAKPRVDGHDPLRAQRSRH